MKYELNIKNLIVALRDIPELNIKKGDLGGRLLGGATLSQEGLCWVYPNATLEGSTLVKGNAQIFSGRISGESSIIDSQIGGENQFPLIQSGIIINSRIEGNPELNRVSLEYSQIKGAATLIDCVLKETLIEGKPFAKGIKILKSTLRDNCFLKGIANNSLKVEESTLGGDFSVLVKKLDYNFEIYMERLSEGHLEFPK